MNNKVALSILALGLSLKAMVAQAGPDCPQLEGHWSCAVYMADSNRIIGTWNWTIKQTKNKNSWTYAIGDAPNIQTVTAASQRVNQADGGYAACTPDGKLTILSFNGAGNSNGSFLQEFKVTAANKIELRRYYAGSKSYIDKCELGR